MNTKTLDKLNGRSTVDFAALVSHGLLEARELPLLEQYACKRLFPLTAGVVLQYLAGRSPGLAESVGFRPLLGAAKGKGIKAAPLIDKLTATNLLVEQEAKTLHRWVIREPADSEKTLYAMAASLAQYSDFLSTERLHRFLDDLRVARLVAPSAVAHWRDRIDRQTINSHYELFDACQSGVRFHHNPNAQQPEEWLLELHRQTATVLPGLAFEQFAWEWVIDATGIKSAICVQMAIQGEFYRMRSAVACSSSDHFNILQIDEKSYYKIFNKHLIDVGSPYRLHVVPMPPLPFEEPQGEALNWGIIALNPQQAEVLRKFESLFMLPYIGISEEIFEPVIGTEDWRVAFGQFQSAGLFNHLSPEQVFNFGEFAFQGELVHYSDFLAHFPGIIMYFDGELGLSDTPYAQLLEGLHAISHGVFEPLDVSDEYHAPVGESAHLSFTIRGKYYSAKMTLDDAYCDPAFWRLVQRANGERNPGSAFYNLAPENDVCAVIFLHERQRALLSSIPGLTLELM